MNKFIEEKIDHVEINKEGKPEGAESLSEYKKYGIRQEELEKIIEDAWRNTDIGTDVTSFDSSNLVTSNLDNVLTYEDCTIGKWETEPRTMTVVYKEYKDGPDITMNFELEDGQLILKDEKLDITYDSETSDS